MLIGEINTFPIFIPKKKKTFPIHVPYPNPSK